MNSIRKLSLKLLLLLLLTNTNVCSKAQDLITYVSHLYLMHKKSIDYNLILYGI